VEPAAARTVVKITGWILIHALTYINRSVLLDGPPREVLSSGTALQLFPTLAGIERVAGQELRA
jgi:hypothetical protein